MHDTRCILQKANMSMCQVCSLRPVRKVYVPHENLKCCSECGQQINIRAKWLCSRFCNLHKPWTIWPCASDKTSGELLVAGTCNTCGAEMGFTVGLDVHRMTKNEIQQ